MKTKNDVAKSVYLLLNIQALQCIIIHSKLLYIRTIPNSFPLENSLRSCWYKTSYSSVACKVDQIIW